jgi:hypothetical protein
VNVSKRFRILYRSSLSIVFYGDMDKNNCLFQLVSTGNNSLKVYFRQSAELNLNMRSTLGAATAGHGSARGFSKSLVGQRIFFLLFLVSLFCSISAGLTPLSPANLRSVLLSSLLVGRLFGVTNIQYMAPAWSEGYAPLKTFNVVRHFCFANISCRCAG